MKVDINQTIIGLFSDLIEADPCLSSELGVLSLYVQRRFRNEGLPFLTKVLPAYAIKILRSIEISSLKPLKEFSSSIAISSPFRVLVEHVGIGNYWPSESPEVFSKMSRTKCHGSVLQILLQICNFWKKFTFGEPPDSMVSDTVEEFMIENEERGSFQPPDSSHIDLARRIVDVCFAADFDDLWSEVQSSDSSRNGPGSVSRLYSSEARPRPTMVFSEYLDKEGKHIKYHLPPIFENLEALGYSSFEDAFYANSEDVFLYKNYQEFHDFGESHWFHNVFPRESVSPIPSWFKRVPICELLAVPKTAHTMRLIAKEDRFNLRAQFPFKVALDRFILKRFKIDLRSQRENQQMAFFASLHKKLASIDVKGGSNCTIEHLLAQVLGHLPFFKGMDSVTTRNVVLPGNYSGYRPKKPDGYVYGSKVNKETGLQRPIPFYRNNSFSSQGSFVCFPVMVLWLMVTYVTETVVFNCKRSGKDPSELNDEQISVLVEKTIKLARFFGDDMIVPSSQMEYLPEALDTWWSIRLNKEKSYHLSNFRESCGLYAYHGVEVTPLRMSWVYNEALPNRDVYVKPIDNNIVKLGTTSGRYMSERYLGNSGFAIAKSVVPNILDLFGITDYRGFLENVRCLKRFVIDRKYRNFLVLARSENPQCARVKTTHQRGDSGHVINEVFVSYGSGIGKPILKTELAFLKVVTDTLDDLSPSLPTQGEYIVEDIFQLRAYLRRIELSKSTILSDGVSQKIEQTIPGFIRAADYGRPDAFLSFDIPKQNRINLR